MSCTEIILPNYCHQVWQLLIILIANYSRKFIMELFFMLTMGVTVALTQFIAQEPMTHSFGLY